MAQKTFDRAILENFGKEYQQDSRAFYSRWLSPDFRYMHPNGIYLSREQVLAGNSQKYTKSDIADLVIFQSGDLAVVSGIHQTERVGADGTPSPRQVACTYTFQQRGGKWLMVASQQTALAPATTPTSLLTEWPALLKARNADPTAFFQERATPDMTFSAGHDGSLHDKAWVLGLFKNQKTHTAVISNLTIQQSGDLAVATGVSDLAVEFQDGKKGTYKDAFTYTHRWQNGRWMLTNIHHTKMEYK
jgi:ketosteroid isomerase-like protein